MKFNSEELLEQFGNVFHAGKWCKRFDCLSCEFFYTCPPKFRDRKAKTERDETEWQETLNFTVNCAVVTFPELGTAGTCRGRVSVRVATQWSTVHQERDEAE